MEARNALRDARQILNDFRATQWDGLVRLRNQIFGTSLFTASLTYTLLCAAIIGGIDRAPLKAALFFYEVAEDTMMFAPAQYVDISAVEEQPHAACYAHVSQTPEKWYPKQAAITRFRGSVAGFEQAEAFLHHWESRPGLLP